MSRAAAGVVDSRSGKMTRATFLRDVVHRDSRLTLKRVQQCVLGSLVHNRLY